MATRRVPCETYKDWSQPAGEPGNSGPPNTEPVPRGKAGVTRKAVQKTVPVSELATQLRPGFVSIVLNAACQDYLNARPETAAKRLAWLTTHLEPLTRLNDPMPAGQTLPLVKRTPDQNHYVACQARAESLLRQLSLGLDYHGQAANYVTLLSPKFYLDALNYVIPLAEGVENAYTTYGQSADNKDVATIQALRAQQEYRKVIELKQGERSKVTALLGPTLDSLKQLDLRRNELWTAVHAADSRFRHAVETKTLGCDFGKVVAIAAAVATVVATGGTAAGLLATSATFVSDKPQQADKTPLPPRFEGAAYVVTTLTKVVTTAQEFGDAGKNLGKVLDGEPT